MKWLIIILISLGIIIGGIFYIMDKEDLQEIGMDSLNMELLKVLEANKIESSEIGGFEGGRQLEITEQNDIDNLFDWDIEAINNSYFKLNFEINPDFYSGVRICQAIVGTGAKNTCFTNLCNTYLNDTTGCDNTNRTRIITILSNLSNYPLVNLSRDIRFYNKNIDVINGNGSFDVSFPNRFEKGESIKLGFGSSVINATEVQPSTPDMRTLCNTNTKKHVVYQFNSTHVTYANNSLDLTNGWSANNSFYSGTTIAPPSISCYNNTVAITTPDTNLDDIIISVSNNEGASFTRYSPITTLANQAERSIVVKGQRVYMVWYNDSADEYMGFLIINTTNGNVIMNKTILTMSTATQLVYPMDMAVNGTGETTDDIFISFKDEDDDDIYFLNSTDGGTTFNAQILVQAGTFVWNSILTNGSTLFISYDTGTAMTQQIEYSDNYGATWNQYFRAGATTNLGVTYVEENEKYYIADDSSTDYIITLNKNLSINRTYTDKIVTPRGICNNGTHIFINNGTNFRVFDLELNPSGIEYSLIVAVGSGWDCTINGTDYYITDITGNSWIHKFYTNGTFQSSGSYNGVGIAGGVGLTNNATHLFLASETNDSIFLIDMSSMTYLGKYWNISYPNVETSNGNGAPYGLTYNTTHFLSTDGAADLLLRSYNLTGNYTGFYKTITGSMLVTSIGMNKNNVPTMVGRTDQFSANGDIMLWRLSSNTNYTYDWYPITISDNTTVENAWVNIRKDYDYSMNGTEVVWRNGTATTYRMVYNFINDTIATIIGETYSCTYSGSGNWILPCHCVLSTNTDVLGNAIIMNSTGQTNISAIITGVSNIEAPVGCVIDYSRGSSIGR